MTHKELLRKRIDILLPWLSREWQLKEERPDLYDMWMDYKNRKAPSDINGAEYDQLYNMWLLHYFLVHGKE